MRRGFALGAGFVLSSTGLRHVRAVAMAKRIDDPSRSGVARRRGDMRASVDEVGLHAAEARYATVHSASEPLNATDMEPLNAAHVDGQTHINLLGKEMKLFRSDDSNVFKQEPYYGANDDAVHGMWLAGMGAAVEVVVGVLFLLLALPLMWFNERRAARLESLILAGQTEYVEVTDAKQENRGNLVYLSGGQAKGLSPVSCSRFKNVGFREGCIRLRTTVEVYQWEEIEHIQEQKDIVGGGKTNIMTYEHRKVWSARKMESQYFKRPLGHQNRHPVSPGINVVDCSNVVYGDTSERGFQVPNDLVKQMTTFSSIHDSLPEVVQPGDRALDRPFSKRGAYFVYDRDSSSSSSFEPDIGDVRVRFDSILDGEKTILALQVEGESLDTFLPFRVVPRGCCCWGIGDKERRRRLIEEGLKSPEEMAEADECNYGPYSLCCCGCAAICAFLPTVFAVFTPQIYHILDGTATPRQCLKELTSNTAKLTWTVRLLGWIVTFLATFMMFNPLLMFPTFVRLLGDSFTSIAAPVVVGFLCLITTLLISCVIMATAHVAYRPVVGCCYFMVAAWIAAVPISMSMG